MAWSKRTGIMLCQPLDEHNLDRNFKEAPKMLVQPKLDGMRAWVDYDSSGDAYLISSEGYIIEGVPHINLLLKDWAFASGQRIPWDGELFSWKVPFEEIVGICKRGVANIHKEYTLIEYHIFDTKTSIPNLKRWQVISEAFERLDATSKKWLKMVDTHAATREEIDVYLDKYIGEGYEGIIVRNPLAPYVEKRPYTILKWKPSKSDIYEVVKVEEAVSEKGEPLGRAGSLLCKDRFGNLFSVGPGRGVTHSVARDIWEHRDEWARANVKVYYQNLTKYGVPRFGKFDYEINPTKEEERHEDSL